MIKKNIPSECLLMSNLLGKASRMHVESQAELHEFLKLNLVNLIRILVNSNQFITYKEF